MKKSRSFSKKDKDQNERQGKDKKDKQEEGASSDELSSKESDPKKKSPDRNEKRTLEKQTTLTEVKSPTEEDDSDNDTPINKRLKVIGPFVGPQPNNVGAPVQAAPLSHLQRRTGVLSKDGAPVDLSQGGSEDSIVQALRYILTEPMFAGLLDRVAAQAAKPNKVQAIINKAQQQANLPATRRDELQAMSDGLTAGAGVVVVDRRNDASLRADHDPDENVIRVGQIGNTEPGWQQDTGDYWPCLARVLFELCNAARADTHRKIMSEAREGDLGCISFVLALEQSEESTGTEFDQLWGAIMNGGPHQVNKGGQTVTSQVPDLRFVNNPQLDPEVAAFMRWNAQLQGGHVTDYVSMWFGNFAQAFKAKNKDEWSSLLRLIAPPEKKQDSDSDSSSDSDSDDEPDVKDITQDVEFLVGVKVDPIRIDEVVKTMRTWYKQRAAQT
ncbi:hypothetical protein [Nonomuraea rhizosphaerae]|uniref:hypothetical protein n=1 Tax=Nonomuraea rhizosphaerae TaxID=2665663 RepID=UPI001C5D09BC|nr:hypothetical protein [Nonomuraea rhizosphaerae]